MSEKPKKPETTFVNSDWAAVPNVHRFSHQAMATTFEVIVQYEDKVYAEQAAQEAFNQLDRLELSLSRYIENSDVARINLLKAGQPLLLGLDTFECLQIARKISRQTQGAFDVTVGFLLDCWRDDDKQPRIPSTEELKYARAHTGMSLMRLHEEKVTVELFISPVRVDLGGIGKGYGVDIMAEYLRDWGIDRALIHGGFSSVLALDAPEGKEGWPVTLSHPLDRSHKLGRLLLKNMAVSGSGLEKGRHIIDPRIGRPVEGKIASWSVTEDSATGDALSTAFMVMNPEEIQAFCTKHAGVRALLILPDEGDSTKIVSAGPWRDGELFD